MIPRARNTTGLLARWERPILLALLVGLLIPALLAQSPRRHAPPATRAEPVTDVLHGTEIVDPYRWLEDQQSPETRAWINAQNEYTESVLRSLAWREELRRRLVPLMKIDSIGVPQIRKGVYFYSKRSAEKDLPVYYTRQGRKGREEVLLDPHPLSPDRSLSISLMGISHDGKILAYGIRKGGEDEVEVHLLDVAARKDLSDRLPRARQGGINFKPDNSGFYYNRFTSEGGRIFYHAVGSDPAKDPEIFGKGYGRDKAIGCDLSEDGRYLSFFVGYGSAADRTEIYFQDLSKQGPITPIVNDIPARFLPEIVGDRLYLRTNWNAPNGRILVVDLKNPARENWREMVPEGEGVMQGMSLVGGKLFVNYLQNVTSRVKVFEPAGKFIREISFPTLGNVGGVSGRWSSKEAFFVFSSFHVPTTIYRYDVAKGRQEVWARLNVPIQSDQFEVKQVWYESRDKTRVPMFVVHKKGLKLDGSHPALLTGYGGFNLSQTPGYSSRAVAWVQNGGVYAVANMRGGGEFGERWHRAGMLESKQNVFDDFIAAAEWLVANRYTNPSKLAIRGGSNGGLLVGAALTQRPELFRAVVCGFPLIDMVRYHKFLVARFWVPEYGSSEDPEQFKYIHAYSPYHRVKPGTKYPAVLVVTGDSDTRVDPLHGRKFAALLQASNGSDRPMLLRYDTKSGHTSGGQPINKQIDDLADELAFLFWQLDVSRAEGSDDGGVPQAGKGGIGVVHCVSCPHPEYAEEARRANYEGTVVLRVVVTADGRATNISVAKRLGLGLDERAIEAVSKWRFKPATGPDGKPVPVWTMIEINFRIYKKPPSR